MPTLVSWVRAHSGVILAWSIIAVTFVISYWSFVRNQGFFTPDSRYYLSMAYLFSGESADSARELTAAFAAHYGIPVPPTDQLFGWGLVQPRVMLPLLAVPFVKVFGPFGLAGATLLITICLIVTLAAIVISRYGAVAGVAIMLMVNGSFYLMSFFGSMLTESFSALWTALALVGAWGWVRQRNVWWLVLCGATTVASAFTRQATLIVTAAFLMAWVIGSIVERRNSRWMWPALVVTVATVVSQVVQSVAFPTFSQLDQFLRQTGADTLGGALLRVPRLAANILWNDTILQLKYDRILLFIIVLAVGGMLLFWKRVESHLLFGAILATALYNITNGTPTQFRYATPGIVFFVVMVAYVIHRTGLTVRRRRAAGARTADPITQGHAEVPAEPLGSAR
jgi:hypothetical protein